MVDQSLLKRRSGGGLSHSGKGGWVGGVSQFCSTDKEEPGGGGGQGEEIYSLTFFSNREVVKDIKGPFLLLQFCT